MRSTLLPLYGHETQHSSVWKHCGIHTSHHTIQHQSCVDGHLVASFCFLSASSPLLSLSISLSPHPATFLTGDKPQFCFSRVLRCTAMQSTLFSQSEYVVCAQNQCCLGFTFSSSRINWPPLRGNCGSVWAFTTVP